MKNRHWYFEGYEYKPRPNPNGKRPRGELVYTGEYYGLALSSELYRRLKALFLAAYILLVLLYFTLSLLPTPCAQNKLVSLPLLAALLPGIFLGMGMLCFLSAPEQWPKRLVRSIYHRTRWSALLYAILLLASLVFHILLCIRLRAFSAHELLYAAGLAASFLIVVSVLYEQRKHPVRLLIN